MKPFFIIVLLSFSLFSFDTDEKVKNLIGQSSYTTYHKLLGKIIKKREYTIEELIALLKNNGLLELFFNNPKMIQTRFSFQKSPPVLSTKILYDSLTTLGYYYFYPSYSQKNDTRYILDIEFKSEHYIDPLTLLEEMKNRGCQMSDISKEKERFNYVFDCSEGHVKEAKPLLKTPKRYINAKGIYWISLDETPFEEIEIKTKKADHWTPYIVFYDKNLEVIDIIRKKKKTTEIVLPIPENTKYIKIMDSFNKQNVKRGVIVKASLK